MTRGEAPARRWDAGPLPFGGISAVPHLADNPGGDVTTPGGRPAVDLPAGSIVDGEAKCGGLSRIVDCSRWAEARPALAGPKHPSIPLVNVSYVMASSRSPMRKG